MTSDAFKIRRRVGFFEIELSQVVIEGTFRQQANSLAIESKITARPFFVYYILLVVSIHTCLIVAGILSDLESRVFILLLPVMALLGMVHICMPYRMVRKQISRAKDELKRNFSIISRI